MTSDHVIILCLCLLAFFALIAVSRKGTCSVKRMFFGVCFLIAMAAAALGVHAYVESDGASIIPHGPLVSTTDIGLGVFFLGLAVLGLLCCSREHRATDADHHHAVHHRD